MKQKTFIGTFLFLIIFITSISALAIGVLMISHMLEDANLQAKIDSPDAQEDAKRQKRVEGLAASFLSVDKKMYELLQKHLDKTLPLYDAIIQSENFIDDKYDITEISTMLVELISDDSGIQVTLTDSQGHTITSQNSIFRQAFFSTRNNGGDLLVPSRAAVLDHEGGYGFSYSLNTGQGVEKYYNMIVPIHNDSMFYCISIEESLGQEALKERFLRRIAKTDEQLAGTELYIYTYDGQSEYKTLPETCLDFKAEIQAIIDQDNLNKNKWTSQTCGLALDYYLLPSMRWIMFSQRGLEDTSLEPPKAYKGYGKIIYVVLGILGVVVGILLLTYRVIKKMNKRSKADLIHLSEGVRSKHKIHLNDLYFEEYQEVAVLINQSILANHLIDQPKLVQTSEGVYDESYGLKFMMDHVIDACHEGGLMTFNVKEMIQENLNKTFKDVPNFSYELVGSDDLISNQKKGHIQDVIAYLLADILMHSSVHDHHHLTLEVMADAQDVGLMIYKNMSSAKNNNPDLDIYDDLKDCFEAQVMGQLVFSETWYLDGRVDMQFPMDYKA